MERKRREKEDKGREEGGKKKELQNLKMCYSKLSK
jgi:hypothetical protein